MNIRNRVAGLLACLGVLSVSGTGAANAADAPAFPTKPVSIVVPYAAGGATDIIARLIGKRLGEVWKQPVVVVNKPGAGTVLGAGFVAKSPGDGYTLYMTTAAHTISGSLYRSLPYDPVKDFA
ncbi:MAG TPA: MFS transporter, partial [Cupriavidus sp.]|nr:MFS transporter [Cupriavidus sp.]HBO80153.1 MFS transporter [Cupriavidus sp.]